MEAKLYLVQVNSCYWLQLTIYRRHCEQQGERDRVTALDWLLVLMRHMMKMLLCEWPLFPILFLSRPFPPSEPFSLLFLCLPTSNSPHSSLPYFFISLSLSVTFSDKSLFSLTLQSDSIKANRERPSCHWHTCAYSHTEGYQGTPVDIGKIIHCAKNQSRETSGHFFIFSLTWSPTHIHNKPYLHTERTSKIYL